MFRNFGSTVKHRFVTSRLVGPAIVAAVVASFAAIGCSSSSDATTTPDAGPTNCNLEQVQALFTAQRCTNSGCHDAAAAGAGLDLASPGVAARLLDKNPTAGQGAIPSQCTNIGKPYLKSGTNPATGLLLDKISRTPGCGSPMPFGYAALSAAQISCIQTWATSVTSP
jgi:hypothetical protein